MQIVYKYYGDWTKEQVKTMKGFGIDLEKGYDNFEIFEGELHEKIKPYLIEWNYFSDRSVGTLYDKKEEDEAAFLSFVDNWTNGYPQPEDEWITCKGITYDLEQYCVECGIGLHQNAPFRLKKAPSWKKRQMFSLEWIYDELFVRKETYETLFKPLGIETWPVLLHRDGSVIEDTLQLKLPTSDIALDMTGQRFEKCHVCDRVKYIPQFAGYFPDFADGGKPKYPICKSQEYMGSGHAADKWILVSQEFRQQLIARGIKGLYAPMKPRVL